MSRTLVLIHGLGRTAQSMAPIEREGNRLGMHAVRVSYPSRRAPIAALAALVGAQLAAEDGPFDVVTHSMGGVLLRAAVAYGYLDASRIRRAVMLAPPNQGSELADWLRRRWYYRLATGPAGQELGTRPGESIPITLPPVAFAVGVIAGTRSLNPLSPLIFSEANDGKVALSRAQVDGMADFLAVRRPHSTLMRAPEVVAATFAFLECGRFGLDSPDTTTVHRT